MAVTSNQLEQLVKGTAGGPFLQRVEFNLVLTAENIATEAPSTAQHAARARLAAAILQNPDQYTPNFAQGVVAQLPLSTTNMVTVGGVPNADVDTTDAAIATIIASVYNDYLPS